MKQVKQVERPARKFDVLELIKCDLCGKTTDAEDYESKSGNWDEERPFSEKTVAVWIQEGYGSPDGGYKEAEVFDVCPDCFQEKVRPLLESLGLKARKEVIDF